MPQWLLKLSKEIFFSVCEQEEQGENKKLFGNKGTNKKKREKRNLTISTSLCIPKTKQKQQKKGGEKGGKQYEKSEHAYVRAQREK